MSDNQTVAIKYDNFYSPQNKDFYSKFRYATLDQAQRGVRLLRIQPLKPGEDEGSRIECELIDSQPLDSVRGKFTTISYCAGDPKQTETIVVDGLEFNAFANLGHALRQARYFWARVHAGEEFLLWADQVCINQSNPDERGHQVGFMGDIYGAATQALVCLSVEGDRSGGIGWLRQIYTASSEWWKVRQRARHMDGQSMSGTDYFDHVKFARHYFEAGYEKKDFHRGWDAFLATFLKSRWWLRAWIRQEYVRSPDAYLMSTYDFIHWKSASKGLQFYFHVGHDLGALPALGGEVCLPPSSNLTACHVCQLRSLTLDEFFKSLKRVERLLTSKYEAEIKGLTEQLAGMHMFEASDPKDLIYACFGISGYSYGLLPSYDPAVSFEEVLIQVAKNIITGQNNLRILQNACATNWKSRMNDIPSWVPDWRNRPRFVPSVVSYSINRFAFHADTQGRSDRILQVRGMRLDLSRNKFFWLKHRLRGYKDATLADREFYALHGIKDLAMLRRYDNYFILLGFLGPDINSRYDLLTPDEERMIASNDAALEDLYLC